MSNYYATKEAIKQVGTAALDASGANTVTAIFGRKARLKRLILVTTVAQTVANATITVAVRDHDDSPSTTIGSFVLPFSGSAIGDKKYVDLVTTDTDGSTSSIDGSLVYEAGDPVEVEPTEELALTSDGGGDAGSYLVFVEYWDQPFTVADGTEVAFVPA